MKRQTLAFALLLALAPAAGLAQDDPTTKAARARFQEGVEFFDKGQFENARAAFLQAYALKKHPAVLINLAQSCAKSNHWVDAAKYYQQYLREAQGITPQQKSEAERGLGEARGKIGRLDIQAGAGSEIYVDNERVGTAPLSEPLDVETGAHAVRIKGSEGSSEQRVSVTGGQLLAVKFGGVSPNPQPTGKVEPNPPPNPNPNPPPTDANPNPNPNPPPTDANPTTSNTTNPPPDTATPTGQRPKTGLYLAIAGGGMAVAGFAIGGIFLGLKMSANDALNNTTNAIVKAGGGAGTCLTTSPYSATPRFQSACKTLLDNQSAVNQDATVANVGLVIGIVGAAAAVGGLVWYFASKPKAEASTTGHV